MCDIKGSQHNCCIKLQEKLARILRAVSVGLLIITVGAAVSVFIIKSSLPLSRLQQEEQQAISAIAPLETQGATYLVLQGRLSDIKSIIEKRQNYDVLLTLISENTPAGVGIGSLTLDEKAIIFTAKTSSLTAAQKFLENITAVDNKIFSKVTLESFSFDPTSGAYSLSFNILRK